MNLTVGQIVTWIIVGALAGTLASVIVRGRRKVFNLRDNLIIGLLGALLGGMVFNLLNVSINLGAITITGRDLLAAFLGSLIVLVVVSYLRGRR